MVDPIYAGIKINTGILNGQVLHAITNIYNAANNAFNILIRTKADDRANVCKELKIPEAYTMDVLAEQKDTTYLMLHFNLLKSFINDLDKDQKEYISSMAAFFNEVYCITYMKIAPNNESRARTEKAYNRLEYCLKNHKKIFNERLLGPNFDKKPIVDFLKKQLKDIVDASKSARKMTSEVKKDKANGDSNTDTES